MRKFVHWEKVVAAHTAPAPDGLAVCVVRPTGPAGEVTAATYRVAGVLTEVVEDYARPKRKMGDDGVPRSAAPAALRDDGYRLLRRHVRVSYVWATPHGPEPGAAADEPGEAVYYCPGYQPVPTKDQIQAMIDRVGAAVAAKARGGDE